MNINVKILFIMRVLIKKIFIYLFIREGNQYLYKTFTRSAARCSFRLKIVRSP